MFFNSLTFGLFLPVTLAAYWLLPARYRLTLLLVASYVFYAWWDYRFLSLIFVSTITDYAIGRRLPAASSTRQRRVLLITSVVVNIGILAFFKYWGFFADSAASLLTRMGLEANAPLLRVILPVGISFYTFQTLSYTIDVFRGKIAPEHNLPRFALFVAFFPQLVAGPIDDGSLANVMRESAGRDHHWLSEASALLARRGVLADWDSLTARERLLESGLWTESGHFTGYYERGPIPEDRWVPPSSAGALDSANEKALREMVSIVTESGARAALLVEPVCCRAGSDGVNERYLAWLRDRAESWDVPILDTFSENWPVELFADPAHLNRAGTEAYTRHLGALLATQLLAAGEEG